LLLEMFSEIKRQMWCYKCHDFIASLYLGWATQYRLLHLDLWSVYHHIMMIFVLSPSPHVASQKVLLLLFFNLIYLFYLTTLSIAQTVTGQRSDD
jgi:hypothetical protein